MITIYHKPGCITSQRVLNMLRDSGKRFRVVHYMEHPLDEDALIQLLEKLNIPAEQLLRTKEKLWSEKYAGKKMNTAQIIRAIADNPVLMQRPVLVKSTRAILARPPEIAAAWI